MNVTNIGFPFAAPMTQRGAADAAAMAGGFGGLLGPAAMPQGGMTFAVNASFPAETTTPLLPGATDPALATLPGDRPQVAMDQLLATAAPAAVTPPMVTGGNPLADAVVKALAKPATGTPTAVAAGTPADAANLDPASTPPLAAPAAAGAIAAKPSVIPVPVKPGSAPSPDPADRADTAVALGDPSDLKIDVPPLSRQGLPGKGNPKPPRIAASDEPLPIPADLAPATAQPSPIAMPQPVMAAPAVAQSAPSPTPQGTKEVPASVRFAGTAVSFAADGAPAPTTAEKTADLARAISGHGGGGNAEGGTAGDGGQQGFSQHLAGADPAALPGQTFSTASTFDIGKPAAAPAAAASTGGEPVLQARPGELGRSLGVEIARKVDAGEDMLRVRLNPAELGRVEVTLAFDDKGNMQATMRAESQHTLDLLRQDAPDLGRALDQAGIRNDAGSFRFESRDGGTGSNAGGQSGFQQQQSRSGNQRFQDEPEIQAAAFRSIRSDGQVDLIA